jgi:hypothetical protein
VENEVNDNGTRIRRYGGESEWGEMHRLDLPPQNLLTDLDSGIIGNDKKLYSLVDEQNTFIEYQRAGFNLCAFKAIFDLKSKSDLNKALELRPFSSEWTQYQIAQRLNCRFFIVLTEKKKPPFVFYEIMSGVVRNVGSLEYSKFDRREKATEFWLRLGLINKQEAEQHLRAKEGNYEVEAIYLDSKNQYIKREFGNYLTDKSANKKYEESISEFRQEKVNALVIMRIMKNNLWHMLRNERT